MISVRRMKEKMLVTQSYTTLSNSMNCNLPGSSVLGIFQARLLKWVAISFSRGSFIPRDQTQVCYIAGRFFTVWATGEACMSQKPHDSFFLCLIGRFMTLDKLLYLSKTCFINYNVNTIIIYNHKWENIYKPFSRVSYYYKPTPVFLPGESRGQGSLVGCHLWGCTESDTTEAT